MATTFKTFLDDDIVSTRTLLHENIPLTGTIISSSVYGTNNIKSYSHGMFQSVYDYPYLSSSANQLFDMTLGQAVGSPGSSSLTNDPFCKKKINIYNQMAQVLVGHDTTGAIMQFDRDGNPATAGDKFTSMFFLNFSRLLSKDEVKKGSFQMTLGIDTSSANPFGTTCLVSDTSGSTNYLINSPAGEYGVLYTTGISNGAYNPNYTADASKAVGFVFYQAGVVALSTAIFAQSSSTSPSTSMADNSYGQIANGKVLEMRGTGSVYTNIQTLFEDGSMNDANAALRNRIKNVTFNNSTELNSSIHFCRINHNEFNYSSNPTYLSGSKIRVKSKTSDAPVSYITTVGLYSPDNELLAVAKLSEPLKKDPTQEMILRVRLDY
jgi:hypothetical protein